MILNNCSILQLDSFRGECLGKKITSDRSFLCCLRLKEFKSHGAEPSTQEPVSTHYADRSM